MENSHVCPKKVKDVSLQELRDSLQEFARARGWEQYHSPRNLLLALVGEVGELSEIFQWKGEVAKGLPDWTSDEKQHVEEELSDVFLYLLQLADVCGVDLGQAALTKIIKNAQKYPVNPTTFN
ncbi:dCTP pyrophosphatase 1-like [Olea europaea var. sylvestris]|uniref:dCTP pyrophosphatase 1-like n=1 Tax=Olea europaea var. sylvestris TaxID=158386 RepID=UPI000C1D40C9|nr:dCTP pyrophosphatase 1-like [Olea europaea var. sylvestris]